MNRKDIMIKSIVSVVIDTIFKQFEKYEDITINDKEEVLTRIMLNLTDTMCCWKEELRKEN